jgi:glucose-induced degradation protein 4
MVSHLHYFKPTLIPSGLTPDYPSLTTFFDGEIIGPKYSFITKHSDWGATEKSDMQHWEKFPAFRPLSKQAKNPDFHYKNVAQRENIFMRWKERFLVPDHTVKEISGASFEGFYYICYNQVSGNISGIYFHSKSDRFVQCSHLSSLANNNTDINPSS